MSLRHPFAVILCMIMAMALVWSRAVLSIFPGGFLFFCCIDIQIQPFKIKWILTPGIIRSLIKYKPFILVYTLFFLLYLVSIVYAGNISEWWKLTHPKFAFLFLPLGFALLKPFSRKEYMLITLSMIMVTVWSSIWVLVAYYSDYELFNKNLGYGGALPSPIAHIRYSVVVAASMITCLFFAIENWKVKYNWERWAYGISALYLFVFLHILSVRSGVVLAYAGILILLFFYFKKLSRLKQLALLLILILAPIIAYKTLPGFQTKIQYTLYDLSQHKAGVGEQYSDSERWQSWRAGIVVGNRHPFFGTGTGKFRTEVQNYYKDELKQATWMRPENQWINVFTIFGLFGIIVFMFMILYPMAIPFFWKPPLMPTLYIMQLLSMLVEHPLDTEFGTSLFLLITVLGLSYQDGVDGSLEKAQN